MKMLKRLSTFVKTVLCLLAAAVVVAGPAATDWKAAAQTGRVPISRDNHVAIRSLVRTPSDGITALAWSADGAQLAAATQDGVVLYDTALLLSGVAAPRRVGDQSAGLPAQAVAFQPGAAGDVLAMAIGGRIEFWDTAANIEVTRIDGAAPIAFDATGERFAYTHPNSRDVRVLNMRTRATTDLRAHQNRVLGLVFSPIDSTLATLAADEPLRLWDARAGQPLTEMPIDAAALSVLTFSPNGAFVAAGGNARDIHLLNLAIASARTYTVPAPAGEATPTEPEAAAVAALDFNPAGSLLIFGIDDALHIQVIDDWAADDRTDPASTVFDLGAPAQIVSFNPDGSLIVTLTQDGMLQLWGV